MSLKRWPTNRSTSYKQAQEVHSVFFSLSSICFFFVTTTFKNQNQTMQLQSKKNKQLFKCSTSRPSKQAMLSKLHKKNIWVSILSNFGNYFQSLF